MTWQIQMMNLGKSICEHYKKANRVPDRQAPDVTIVYNLVLFFALTYRCNIEVIDGAMMMDVKSQVI